MKISIAGTRGIPNQYGGFEQCAERLSVILSDDGHEVTVYNPSYHSFSETHFQKVSIVKKWNPEKQIGTIGNFIYDFLCMKHAYKNGADVLLMLGYTTSSVFFPFLPKRNCLLVTNMDGMEWRRSKWNRATQVLTMYLEKLAARYSDICVADNVGIADYLKEKYHSEIIYIPYGADEPAPYNEALIKQLEVSPGNYDLVIARLEKENNIELIADAVLQSSYPCLIVGGTKTTYGRQLLSKYKHSDRVRFVGGIYDKVMLDHLRHYSRLYFHGHSVGGTNPSLLEAMAAGSLIVAHDNPFNRAVTGEHAGYFKSADHLTGILSDPTALLAKRADYTASNRLKISNEFSWEKIAGSYEKLFTRLKS